MVMQTTLWCKGRWQHKADRRVYTNFQQLPGVPLWEKIKVPALVIKGEQAVRARGAGRDSGQSVEVPASDHHITLENPRGFVDVVRNFLSG